MSRGGENQYRSRFGPQENDRVSHIDERGGELYGRWSRDPEEVPGARTFTNRPDMRDNVNREEFLGETREDRLFQRAANILRGAIDQGLDPQEILEVAQQPSVSQGRGYDRGRGGDRGGRDRGDSGRDRGSRDRGVSMGGSRGDSGRDRGGRDRESGRPRDSGRGRDTDRAREVCRRFEEVHQDEVRGVQGMRDILRSDRLGNRDWQELDEICREAKRRSDEEREVVRQVLEMVKDLPDSSRRRAMEICEDLENVNSTEYQVAKELEQALQDGDPRRVEDLCGELSDQGRREGDLFNQVEELLADYHFQDREGGSRESRSSRGSGSGWDRQEAPRNYDGSLDLRDTRNKEEYLERRGMASFQGRDRGEGPPRNVGGDLDLRDTRNRAQYQRERGIPSRQPGETRR